MSDSAISLSGNGVVARLDFGDLVEEGMVLEAADPTGLVRQVVISEAMSDEIEDDGRQIGRLQLAAAMDGTVVAHVSLGDSQVRCRSYSDIGEFAHAMWREFEFEMDPVLLRSLYHWGLLSVDEAGIDRARRLWSQACASNVQGRVRVAEDSTAS